jgi:nucleoside phosphorylase
VIFTALKEEFAAVQAAIPDSDRSLVRIIRAGVGWDSAMRATSAVLNDGCPRWICFSGFCGGLADGLAVGDVVLSSALQEAEFGVVNVDEKILAALQSALQKSGMKFQAGRIACARRAVISEKDKRELGRTSQSIAVDMESFAVAKAAAGKCPCFALRAVSDAVTDALPPEVAGFLDKDGGVRMGKVTRFMLGGVNNIKILMELKSRSEKACASLTAAWKAAWPALKTLEKN